MKPSYRLNNILWSLRKIRLPLCASDLVLDVGSGSNPHPAADVLLEKYVDATHRYEALVVDRPTVLADACKMPFKDKTFDFILAFHVLEHMHDPAAFMKELQRVGKAGYIETPNAIFERLSPYDVHLLEIMDVEGVLRIHKKSSASPDSFLNGINLIKKNTQWRKFFYRNPELFHIRYIWKDRIQYEIMNPETSTDWFIDPEMRLIEDGQLDARRNMKDFRGLAMAAIRKWYCAKKRKVDLDRMLVCPECHGGLKVDPDYYCCPECGTRYSRRSIPDFTAPV
ncbi:MAG: methyltransferase domain-containing protein [Proteobacteria bacterium]|nr:methyltransferase domain-containing protein [Pseudomonadota bacterium]